MADRFNGDRYARVAQGVNANEVAQATKRKTKKPRKGKRKPGTVAPLTLAQGFGREVGSGLAGIAGAYLGGNPVGWHRRWCGAFMRLVVRQAGLPDNPQGNLARNWRHYGRPTSAHANAIGVMPGHVGIVIGRCPDGRILLRSGNHGRRVGDGCYAARRFIAFRTA